MDLPFRDHYEDAPKPLIMGYADSTVTHSPCCIETARMMLDQFEQSRSRADYDALVILVSRIEKLVVVQIDEVSPLPDD